MSEAEQSSVYETLESQLRWDPNTPVKHGILTIICMLLLNFSAAIKR